MKIENPHLLFNNEYVQDDYKQRLKVIITFALVISTMLIVTLLNIKGVN